MVLFSLDGVESRNVLIEEHRTLRNIYLRVTADDDNLKTTLKYVKIERDSLLGARETVRAKLNEEVKKMDGVAIKEFLSGVNRSAYTGHIKELFFFEDRGNRNPRVPMFVGNMSRLFLMRRSRKEWSCFKRRNKYTLFFWTNQIK